ncbi:WbqC family protein [Sporosarcina sp. 179-K 3D1 HS]|uniref:WbqC family protein n=1 Tax=Sporosarcina sp. 179-K 3D1 HS TaxID=3232169 RepID=UPI00399F5EDC
MKVAIHQPNYLPWIGYFDKLDQVDKFVLLDKAAHSKSGFINRNKIKTPQGELWLSVPLKNKEKPVSELQIANDTNWLQRHWKSIEANYKRSPYWDTYKDGLQKIYHDKWTHLAPLNIALILHLKEALQIKTDILLESDLKHDFGSGNARNVNIVSFLGGTLYVSGTGARAYNREEAFTAKQIQLVYQEFHHPVYPQRWGGFRPNLSMIDMLFNCGPETMDLIRKQRRNKGS